MASDPDAKRYRVIAIELDDVVPRRRADRPNVYVGITTQRRDVRYAQLAWGRGGPDWIGGHVLRLRADLTRNYPATTQSDIRRQKRRVIRQLMRRGYTVNRDERLWKLYVVELDADAVEDAGCGWVYVGETIKDPSVRLEEHLGGARNKKGKLYSAVVHKHGVALRVDLMDGLPVFYSAEDAKNAERELAASLLRKGYNVEGGH